MKKKQKAFYTLEATWMFGLALLIFIGIILFTIRLCGETYDDIAARQPAEIEAVTEFREINAFRDFGDAVTGDGKEKEE